MFLIIFIICVIIYFITIKPRPDPIQVGHTYIITIKEIDTTCKPAAETEWRIKILDISPDTGRLYIEYLSGSQHIIGKKQHITYDTYHFEHIPKN